jgi:hypothetical protein
MRLPAGIGVRAVLLAALLRAGQAAAEPSIFWVSQPVRPGETVLAQGDGWGDDARVTVWRVPDPGPSEGTPAPLLQTTPRSLKFTLPNDWPMGVYAFRVNGGPLTLVNAPELWWVQGNRGRRATPGGWFRAFGTCLSLDRMPTATLSRDGKAVITLAAQKADEYTASFTLPENVAEGKYTLALRSGHGNGAAPTQCDAELVVAAPDPWPQNVFTGELSAALAAAAANGGGIVALQPGTNELRKPVAIPPRTILRGAGRDTTVLRWSSIELSQTNKPVGLLSGTSFGLEDLSIVSLVPHAGPGVCRTADPDGWAFLRRVRISLANEPKPGRHAVYIDRAENTEIVGCAFEGAPRAIGLNRARFALISGNDLRYGWNGVTMNASSEILFEGNSLCVTYSGPRRDSGSNFTAYGAPVARNLYFARNRLWSPEHHDNGFTFDGGDGLYFGKVVKAEGKRVTLEEPPLRRRGRDAEPRADWIGASLHIMEGPGAGQYRHVVGFNGPVVEVDHPWDIAPDGHSVVTLANFIGRVLLVDNDFEDSVWTKAYAMTADVIFAGNRIGHHTALRGCFDADAGTHNTGFLPGFHFQALDNRLLHGATHIGCNGRHIVNKRSQKAGLSYEWYEGAVMLGSVFRRNSADPAAAQGSSILIGSSHPGVSPVADVVIEHNAIPEIRIERNNRDIVVRDNPGAVPAGPGARGPGVRWVTGGK